MGIVCRRAAAAVRPRDNFQEMPIGVIPIHPAAAIPRVDLTFFTAVRVCPIGQASVLDPQEYCIELSLVHQKRIVLRLDFFTMANGPIVSGAARPKMELKN